MRKNINCWIKVLKNLPDSYKKGFEEEKKYLIKTIQKNSKVLDVGVKEEV